MYGKKENQWCANNRAMVFATLGGKISRNLEGVGREESKHVGKAIK